MKHRYWVTLIFLVAALTASSQVRFYAQFRSIPFTEAWTNDFNILTGVRIDPNKELLVGLGLTGRLSPNDLRGSLGFNKSSIRFSFNYYLNRKWYLNGELNYNLVRDVFTDLSDNDPIVVAGQNLIRKIFFDYDINVNYIILQRLHFSFGTGVADFARLARNTTSEVLEGKFQLNVSLALKVYLFQIKF